MLCLSRVVASFACLMGMTLAACGQPETPQASPAQPDISVMPVGLPLVDGVQTYSGEWKLLEEGDARFGAYMDVGSAGGKQVSWLEALRMEEEGDATAQAYSVMVTCIGGYEIRVSGSARVLVDPLSLGVDGLLGDPMLALNEESTAEVSIHTLTGDVGTEMFPIVAETVDAMAKAYAIEFFPIRIRYNDTAALKKLIVDCERVYGRYR